MALFLKEYFKKHSINPHIIAQNAMDIVGAQSSRLLLEDQVVNMHWRDAYDFLKIALGGLCALRTAEGELTTLLIHATTPVGQDAAVLVYKALDKAVVEKKIEKKGTNAIVSATLWTALILTMMDKVDENKKLNEQEALIFVTFWNILLNAFQEI